jgi:hypothetical protein
MKSLYDVHHFLYSQHHSLYSEIIIIENEYIVWKGLNMEVYNLIKQNVCKKIYDEYYKEYCDFWR